MDEALPSLAVDATSTEPPYRQIREQIARAIRAGELQSGTALPTVRALARRLAVNINTVSRAYADLGTQGLLVARRGGGTKVAQDAADRLQETRQTRLHEIAQRALSSALGLGCAPEELEAAVAVAVARWRSSHQSRVSPERPRLGTLVAALRFVGSHDLSVELLRVRLAARRRPVRLEAAFLGSLEGLMALAHGEAEVAGCHLLDEESGEYNVAFVRRLLPGRSVLLVTLATRTQGFMLRPGQPDASLDLATLVDRGCRFAIRQRGSGTRVLFEHLLREAGLTPAQIRGSERELPSHLSVAEAVASGLADIGLGIEAAARALGLGFVPLGEEPYELAIPAELAETPEVKTLLAALQSPPLRRLISALDGYDARLTGRVRHVA